MDFCECLSVSEVLLCLNNAATLICSMKYFAFKLHATVCSGMYTGEMVYWNSKGVLMQFSCYCVTPAPVKSKMHIS